MAHELNQYNPFNASTAVYKEYRISAYNGNPLIMALPSIHSNEEIISQLTCKVPYSEEERLYSSEERLHLIGNTLRFFQPLGLHVELAQKFSRMLRMGYIGRNPFEKGFYQWAGKRLSLMQGEVLRDSSVDTTASGFTVLGLPGVGKSKGIEAVLSMYPQVIVHHSFEGKPFHFVQIVWLKLECQYDVSLRGLCLNFFLAVDKLLGTNYYENYTRQGRATV